MRILLDECIDRRFRTELRDHTVVTAQGRGWTGLKNGDLLRAAEAEFDLFITVDRNLHFQQNLPAFKIGVAILHARSNRLVDLKPLAAVLMKSLDRVKPGEVLEIRL